MALDLEKIRAKVAQLNGDRKGSGSFSDWKWKPAPGVYFIRILPWRDSDGQPIKERNIYYNIGVRGGAMSPAQFQKPDPIKNFMKELYEENTEETKALAKKLYPATRGYVPLIVRGEEDKGVRVWDFGQMVYKRLYSMLLDHQIGDFTDPMEGRDLKVTIIENKKKQYEGKPVMETTIDPSLEGRTPISKDKKLMASWLDNLPNIDEKLPQVLPYDELKKALDDYLNGATKNKSDGEEHIKQKKKEEPETKVDSELQELDDAFADLD